MNNCIKCCYIFIIAKSKKVNQSTKGCWINEIIVAIKIYLIKKVLLQPNPRSRLHINHYIMCRLFNMYTIISMYTEILFYSRPTHICWMENNRWSPVKSSCLFVLVFRKYCSCMWKVSKRNKKDYKPNLVLSFLT